MTKTHHDRLTRAMGAALDRYALVMCVNYPIQPKLTVSDSDVFEAVARLDDEAGLEIVVSTGVVTHVRDLWHRIMEKSEGLPEDDQLNVGDVEQAIDASLMWLMLHELHHHQIGHLEICGSAGIAETGSRPELALTRRSGHKPSVLDGLPKDQSLAIQRCLELQADHDALEILLDHYSDQGWEYIRFYMASCMAVMVLIDSQDQASDEDRTHPYSATRIFQIFGALAALWKPTPTADWEAPEDDEIAAFHAAVVVPAVSDAIIIAEAGGAQSILSSRQEANDLFDDILMLQEPNKHDLTQLKTAGAREYASLMPFNAQAIEILGPEKFFI